MKRFSKKHFVQIMLNRLLKHELDSIKKTIAKEIAVNYNLSYGDIIKYLLNHYKQSKKFEYVLEPKLNVSIPLQPVASLNVTTKLDGKQRISYSVES